MQIGVIADQVFEMLSGKVITDQGILDFIDMGEWISLWLGVTLGLISVFGLVAIYAERKVSAHMQSRLGPMRVGPKGLLQTLADGIKLLEKEDLTPTAADPVLFNLAPMFVFASAVAMFVVLPFFSWEGKSHESIFDLSPSEVLVLEADVGQNATDDELADAFAEAEATALEGQTELQSRKTRIAISNGEAIRELEADDELGVKDLLEKTPFASLGEALNVWNSRISLPLGESGAENTTVERVVSLARHHHQHELAKNAAEAAHEDGEDEEEEAAHSHPPHVSDVAGALFSLSTDDEDNQRFLTYAQAYEMGAMSQINVSRADYVGYLHLCFHDLLDAAEGKGEYAPSEDGGGAILAITAHVDRPWFGTPAWMNAGLFFILAISSVSVIGVVLAGWGSNNKWSLYGAIREAAQMVSYEIPMGIGALCVVVANQSLNLMDIAQIQETGTIFGLAPDVHLGILSWNIIKFPVLFLVFIMFYIGVLAHTKRAPFDLPEAESELIAGFLTEYSGMRWSLFFLAEYGEMYAMSALTAVLFMGGMASPIPLVDGLIKDAGPLIWMIWGATWLVLKSCFLVFVMMWLRWTLPRIRLDQVMYLCLKVLLPFSMVTLLLQTLWSLDLTVGIGAIIVTLIVLYMLLKRSGDEAAKPDATQAKAALAAS